MKKMILGFITLSSLSVFAEERLEFGENFIKKDNEYYFIHLNARSIALPELSPRHQPYPIDYRELRVPIVDCVSIFGCISTQPLKIFEHHITGNVGAGNILFSYQINPPMEADGFYSLQMSVQTESGKNFQVIQKFGQEQVRYTPNR